jgi:signal transduction histidine kinase
LNIIVNAEQAMTEASGGGALRIRSSQEDDRVVVAFTNSGLGIPEENLQRLFEPFFSTKTERGGTGLGLSVCHGIISEHNGKIYAESVEGEGATFIVELPIVAP